MFTEEFERYVQPARPRAQLWRLFVGVPVMLTVYFIGVAAVFAVIWLTSGTLGLRNWSVKLLEASSPTGAMLLMASFIGMAIAPMVAVRLLHRRKARTLFGPKQVVVRDFLRTAGIVLAIYSLLTLGWSFIYDGVPNLNFLLWLTFLPIALLGVLIQTGAEELVFRGYFQQQLGARFNSPVIWMLLPSLAFGLAHYNLDAGGQNTWYIVATATVFGLIAADLTRISGSIGAAWGFHFSNNVIAVLIVATDGTIPGLALYLTPYTADDASKIQALIFADYVGLFVAWMILRRVLSR